MFKITVMLVALNETVDAVYCPTAVTPVTKIVPFSSACSLAMSIERDEFMVGPRPSR